MKIRIGTRGSALARAQSDDVARRLAALGHTPEIVVISTAGDRSTDRAFADVGAFGIFVREIEAALLDGSVDAAVHSFKDLPSRSPDGLVIAAVPERLDPADVLLIRADSLDPAGANSLPLRAGALVGTSAARRTTFLRALRPDVRIGMLRGNVPTRLRTLDGAHEGARFEAIILATAGLERLNRAMAPASVVPAGVTPVRLDPAIFVPAPAQGAIAVQVRADDGPTRTAVAALNDPAIARAVSTERAILAHADGGCTLPFGAWCREEPDGRLRLVAALGTSDGPVRRAELLGRTPEGLAESVWQMLCTAYATPVVELAG